MKVNPASGSGELRLRVCGTILSRMDRVVNTASSEPAALWELEYRYRQKQ